MNQEGKGVQTLPPLFWHGQLLASVRMRKFGYVTECDVNKESVIIRSSRAVHRVRCERVSLNTPYSRRFQYSASRRRAFNT